MVPAGPDHSSIHIACAAILWVRRQPLSNDDDDNLAYGFAVASFTGVMYDWGEQDRVSKNH
jgi:hypothetical protein